MRIQGISIGDKFSRLTLKRFLGTRKGHHFGEWECECGKVLEIRISGVRTGNTLSCGCLNLELVTKLGFASKKHGGKGTPEYYSYNHMKARCYRTTCAKYKNYGARGITITERWLGEHGFENFLADMGKKPTPEHSIERVNNDGNYEPGNCIWATMDEQAKNKTTTIRLELNGQKTYQADLAKKLNVDPHSIEYHLGLGKTPEQIVHYFNQKKTRAHPVQGTLF